jgi:hypothetical protein
MMTYIGLDPRFGIEDLGLLPMFIDDADERPAREQYDSNYEFGGWNPIEKFEMFLSNGWIKYPGDPVLKPFAMTSLRDERIYFYRHALVAIVQPDGAFEVARLD